MTQEYLKKKGIIQVKRPRNSSDINIIENIWFISHNKLPKFNIQNIDDIKTALQTVWTDTFDDITKNFLDHYQDDFGKWSMEEVLLVVHNYLVFLHIKIFLN